MNLEMGRDIGMALEDLSPFDCEAVRPRLNISFEANEAKKNVEDRQYELDYNIDYKAHKYGITKHEENLVKACEFLWDRCSIAMRAKIEARKDYDTLKNDPIELIKAIKEYAMAYQDTKYPVATILDSMDAYLNN